MTIVEINHLQVTFAEKTAVSAASFSVNAGETFSLIGESGCGKSTILRVIAGLQRDWRGQVSLFGHTIKPDMRFQGDLRRNVQMVFQDPYASLHPNHTLWRTLAEPLKIRGEREIEKHVHTALEQVGLPADAATRINFPVVSDNVWLLLAPYYYGHNFFCWMNPPQHWICRYKRKFLIC